MPTLNAKTAAAVAGEPGTILRMEVEEWGVDVCYTPLTGVLVTKLGALSGDEDADKHDWIDLTPEILHDCVVDEDGGRVFTWDQIRRLLSDVERTAVCMKVVAAIIKATNLEDQPDEDGRTETEKN